MHCPHSFFCFVAPQSQAPQEEQRHRGGDRHGGGGGGDRHGGGGHHSGGDTRSGLQQAFGGAGGLSLGAMGGSGASSAIVGGVHRGPMNPERMAMLAGAPPPPMPMHSTGGGMNLGAMGHGMGQLGQMGGRGGGGNSTNDPTKNLRRIYVGNLPSFAGEEHVRAFFCDVMRVCFCETDQLHSFVCLVCCVVFLIWFRRFASILHLSQTACPNLEPGDSVLSVYLNAEKKFAFVEFRTIDEASAAAELDGVSFRCVHISVLSNHLAIPFELPARVELGFSTHLFFRFLLSV